MALSGFFVRGAVTLGPLCVTEEIIFGTGLIESYQLEAKAAIVPRVVVTEPVLKAVMTCIQTANNQLLQDNKDLVCRDIDGWWFVNYLQAALEPSGVNWKQIEHHKNAVLASTEHRVKASLRSPLMIPRVALVDPELTVSCPPPVTAASGLDALTQCLEPFVSVRATPLTDGLAREGLRRAATGLRAAHADGGDLAARTDMAMCALLGGMALANAKLGAVHGLAGVIGGTADVPHGMACAALLAPVIEANVRALRSAAPGSSVLDRYAEAAQLLTGKPGASVEDGLAWIGETVSLLGVPGLAAFGLGPGQADEIAAKAMTSSSMQGNPVPLSQDELTAVVLQAL
jgi:alcohol dehydrogenase class IV